MPDFQTTPISEMESFYHGLFRRARAELGVTSFGMAVVELEPHADNYPDHDHPGGQEEVLVVLSGTGELTVEGESIPLVPESMVRIAPDAKRKVTPGAEGMRLLALGGIPGSFDAPAYTELGAPDPLDR